MVHTVPSGTGYRLPVRPEGPALGTGVPDFRLALTGTGYWSASCEAGTGQYWVLECQPEAWHLALECQTLALLIQKVP